MQAHGWGLSGFVLVMVASTGAHADVASEARAVLQRHCASCHGGGTNSSKGGFGYLLRSDRLIAEKLVVPRLPDESTLLKRVRAGEMPPKTITARPSAAELAVLRRWIEAGAPALTSRPKTRGAIGLDGLERRVRRDLARHPLRTRRHLRYFSLVHLHDGGARQADMAQTFAALRKLLNSLSWQRRWLEPVAVDAERTVYRVDLRRLGWRRGRWNTLARTSPFALIRSTADGRYIRQHAGASTPIVRADWFVATASRPPMYHRLLGVPTTVDALGSRLGVDFVANRRRLAVVRAGFNGSGVSRNNRVIERHRGRHGYVWVSFDFANSRRERNIFENPTNFRPDGSEIIFALPNGMQGYMIADGSGRRIDRAPTGIVVDPARSDRVVENGLSCMGCHRRGIIDKRDQIRAHVQRNARAFARSDPHIVGASLAMYRPAAHTLALMRRDRAAFEAALGKQPAVEPISAVAQRFEAPLDLATAAAELGTDAATLHRHMTRNPQLRIELGALFGNGTIKRDAFATVFVNAARSLGQGEVARFLDRVRRAEIRCEVGFRSACFRAADAYARGRHRRVDRRRALGLFDRGCRGGHAESCRRVGHLYYRGRAVRRDRPLASRFYYRACRLGSATGCANAGYLYINGLGVGVNERLALHLYARACWRGRGDACVVAGKLAFYGTGRARRDRSRAARLYERGCDLGAADGCYRLGLQYRWGQGVVVNWWRSHKNLRRACNLGNRSACWHAGDVGKALKR